MCYINNCLLSQNFWNNAFICFGFSNLDFWTVNQSLRICCLMSFAQWGLYSFCYRDLGLLNVDARKQQSIFTLVSIIFREYLLDSVILSLMVNEAALTCWLSLSTVQIGLLPFWELRLMQASLLLHSLLCFLLFVYFL